MFKALMKRGALSILWVGLCWIYYLAILGGPFNSLESAERKEYELKSIFESKHRKATNLDAYRDRLRKLMQAQENLRRWLPDAALDGSAVKIPNAEIVATVTEFAARNGVVLRNLDFGDTVTLEFYAQRQLSLGATGRYEQLVSFMHDVLGEGERFFLVRNFAVEGRAKQADVVMRVDLLTFGFLSEDAWEGLTKRVKRK